MSEQSSPTVRAWELGIRLREHREQVGMTAAAVGAVAQCTQGYVSGVEAGKLKITTSKLAQLMAAYDLDAAEQTELEQLRTAANQRAWWHKYAPLLSNDFKRFLGYEAGANHIRGYEGELVPGLLQTEDYARAVINAGYPFTRLTEMARRVELRLARQARLDGDDPLQLTYLLGEATLRYKVGGTDVMRRQLEHLAHMASEKEHIELRVLPFDHGAHPTIGASFQILSFTSPYLPDRIWQEAVTSTSIVDNPAVVTEHVVTFAQTTETALNPSDSLDLLRRVAKEMR